MRTPEYIEQYFSTENNFEVSITTPIEVIVGIAGSKKLIEMGLTNVGLFLAAIEQSDNSLAEFRRNYHLSGTVFRTARCLYETLLRHPIVSENNYVNDIAISTDREEVLTISDFSDDELLDELRHRGYKGSITKTKIL